MADPIFNVSVSLGTIDTLVANGLSQEDATPIDRTSANMVLLLTFPGGNNAGFILSPDFQVGDIIEFHNLHATQSLTVYAASGETGNGGFSYASGTGIAANGTKHLRKISASTWRIW